MALTDTCASLGWEGPPSPSHSMPYLSCYNATSPPLSIFSSLDILRTTSLSAFATASGLLPPWLFS